MTNAVERHSSKIQAVPGSIGKPVTWLGLPRAMFVVFFLPKRISSRVFESTWKKAIAILLISTVLSIVLFFAGMIVNRSGQYTIPPNHVFLSQVELPDTPVFVEKVMVIGSRCVNYLLSSFHLESTATFSGLIVPIIFIFVCPFLSVLLMPLLSGRLTIGQRYLRSLRAVFWASVVTIPMSVTAFVLLSRYEWILRNLHNNIRDTFDLASLGLFSVWFIFVAGRLAFSYRKTDEISDFDQVAPRCIQCGYTLYGLPIDSRCPECGQACRLSYSRLQEQSPWAVAAISKKTMAYLITAWQVMLGRSLFGNSLVNDERSDAVTYLVVTSILAGVSLGIVAFSLLDNHYMYEMEFILNTDVRAVELSFYSVPCGLMFFGSIAFFLITLLMALLASCFYRRNWNMNFVVTAYSSTNFLLPIVLVVVLLSMLQSSGINMNRNFLVFGASVCLESICHWSVVVIAIFLLFRAIANLIRALYLNRFGGLH